MSSGPLILVNFLRGLKQQLRLSNRPLEEYKLTYLTEIFSLVDGNVITNQ